MNRNLSDLLIRRLAALASPGGARGRLSILIYHRVLEPSEPFNLGHPTAPQFEAQMRAIASQFTPLALDDAIARLRSASLPPRAIAVTFDDGYADNATVALPILARFGIPATFFVATAFIGGGRMWNDAVIEALRALPSGAHDLRAWGCEDGDLSSDAKRVQAIRSVIDSLKYVAPEEREARVRDLAQFADLPRTSKLMMSEDQIRELRAAGMAIGAHTETHPILARCDALVARREIAESGRRLAEIIHEPVRLFAYPNGKPGADYTPAHAAMVRDAGYAGAVSTVPGAADRCSDVYQLPRFTPWDRDLTRFSLRLVTNLRRPVAAAA